MSATLLPDIAGAINSRLRASPALAGTRISTARQASWGLPSYAVLINPGRGGGEDDTPGLLWERVELRCYGGGDGSSTQARNANTLWRTVHAWFCPPIGSGRAAGFVVTASGEPVSVLKVDLEGGPLRFTEPDEGWPYTWASYRVTYGVG
jgi:hypothetical protein